MRVSEAVRRRIRGQPDLPPGPRRPPLLQTWAWVRQPVALLEDCARRFGSRFTLRFIGGRSYVIVSDPTDVKRVFTARPDVLLSGRANENFRPFVGDHSLFVLDGVAHKRRRRMITPPLRGDHLRSHGELIRDLTLADMKSWPRDRPFRAIDRMRDITLEVIIRAVFGVVDPDRAARITRLTNALTERGSAVLTFIRPLHIDLGPRSPWGRFVRVREGLFCELRDEIARARRDPHRRDDILARLVAQSESQGDPMTDDEILSELLTLVAAGHETSTAALAWAFQWLLGDPEVRRRAVTEARDHATAGVFDPAAAGKLEVLVGATYETLRLSPVIPIVPRWCAEPLSLGDIELSAGTYVAPCVYLTQRDPAVYPEPDRFMPERFAQSRPGPFEYFPFGGSHRLCVGNSFTLFEVPLILATVFAAAELSLAGPRRQAFGRHGITLSPAGGTPIRLERRL